MSRRLSLGGRILASVAILLGAAQLAAAAAAPAPAAGGAKPAKSAAEMLPPTTLVYLEIQRPKDVLALLDLPVAKRLEQSPDVMKALETPQFKEFQTLVGLVEQRAGVKWRAALETMAGQGVAVAIDPLHESIVVMSRSEDAKTTAAVRDALFSLARDDAKNKGNPDPVESKDYRGLTAYKAGELLMTDLGPWLMLANKPAAAKDVADRFLDGGAALAADEHFTAAHATAAAAGKAAPAAWAFVRLDALRALEAGKPWVDSKTKSDNPAIEFLLGGLLPVLRKSPYLAGTLTLDGQDLRLSVASPYEAGWVPPERQFFFAPAKAAGGAAPPLTPAGMLLTVSTYRDLSALWQAAPDLFTEAVAAQLAQADSGLSTVFGGKSFGGDVLGAVEPQLQFVVARQDYKAAGVRPPGVQLPGAALVFRVEGEQFAAARKRFRVGFQSVVALGNIDAAGKGRPLLEAQVEKRGGADILFATYDADEKPAAAKADKAGMAAKGAAKDDIYQNFSPALVMSDKYLMLCTTRQIAEDLADQTGKDAAAKPAAVASVGANTFVQIDAAGVASLIGDNREQLIAQNMLEKGHDRAAAEKEVDLLHALVGAFRTGMVRLTPTDKSIRLDLELKGAGEK